MDILTVDYQSSDVQKLFAQSLHETGFAIIKNHPIDWRLVDDVYTEWYGFFNDPARYDYLFDVERQDGYRPISESEAAKGSNIPDLKEFYHLFYPWGRYPEFLSDATRQLFKQMFALGKQLLQWIDDDLPVAVRENLDRPLSKMLSMERSLHRVLYYPALNGNEPGDAVRAAAHEDINLITLLPAATEAGLQVKGPDGQWHDIEISPETLVINIADTLQEATQGYYKSTTHRVINPVGANRRKPRLSIPLFIDACADVRLSSRYPTADAYREERLRELGLKPSMAS